jgi:hypothetical protein
MSLRSLRRLRVLAMACVLVVIATAAHAARMGPPPLVQSFDEGYGVLAVSLIEHRPTGEEEEFSGDFHLKVEQVVAQPTSADAFDLKPGGQLVLRCSRGYGAEMERFTFGWPPKTGEKYIVVVRLVDGRYQSVPGSGAVREVQAFDERELQAIARIRDLAAAKPQDRPALARKLVVADNNPHVELASNCHTIFRKTDDPAERDKNLAFLRGQWKAVSIQQSHGVLQLMDRTLCELDRNFATSNDRIDGWFGVIFAPIRDAKDPRSPGQPNTHLLPWHLSDLARYWPDKVAHRVIREMHERSWPLDFRIQLAGVLLGMYLTAEGDRPAWAVELDRFYAAALGDAGVDDLHRLAVTVTSGLQQPRYNIRRRYVADEAVWDAMADALKRMEAGPGDGPAASAARTLREALAKRPAARK